MYTAQAASAPQPPPPQQIGQPQPQRPQSPTKRKRGGDDDSQPATERTKKVLTKQKQTVERPQAPEIPPPAEPTEMETEQPQMETQQPQMSAEEIWAQYAEMDAEVKAGEQQNVEMEEEMSEEE